MADQCDDDDQITEDAIINAAVTFDDEVKDAIQQVIPVIDSLDKPDFNAVEYINTLFPSEQSLVNIDDVILQEQRKLKKLDNEILGVVRSDVNGAERGKETLFEAQRTIRELFTKIADIKGKAEKSERMVKEITRDIKQLDNAKRHLTIAITVLNHVRMLVEGVDQLSHLTQRREYKEAAKLLQGVIHVFEHLQRYIDIPQISELAKREDSIKTQLALQIREDFERAFKGPASKLLQQQQLIMEACKILDVLDQKVKSDILSWFVKLQLEEYAILFSEEQDDAWLDKIDKRYTWIKRKLVDFEDKLGKWFPIHWYVGERMCVEFCNQTRKELSKIMGRRVNDIDMKLLLFAVQRTSVFEQLCAKRYPGSTIVTAVTSTGITSPLSPTNPFLDPEEEPGAPTAPTPRTTTHPFIGIISRCFEPHLNIYIDYQNQSLSELIDRFVSDLKAQSQRQATDESSNILPSCADLFVYYKQCMQQCSQLSNGEPMLQLAMTFGKYLKEYAYKVLMANLPSNSGKSNTSTASLLQSILKEGESWNKLTEYEQWKTCSLLCTAEYCLETTQQLESKLKEKIDPSLTEKIQFGQEIDAFHSVIKCAIEILVHDVENVCEPALTAMTKLQWFNVESVGDQSAYITSICNHLKNNVPIIRENLAASRKYFTQFCIKLVSSFTPRFIAAMLKCKPIGEIGAEQLLLDTHSLKTLLLDLPSIGSQVARKAPSSYTRIVLKGMFKAEMILKLIMAPHTSNPAFVDNYAKFLPESDVQELHKVLDMKGIKRTDQAAIVEIYKSRNPSAASVQPVRPVNHNAGQESSRIKRLEKLINKITVVN